MNQLPGLSYIGTITNPHVNQGAPVPLYEPVNHPGGINTLEGWNALADKQNRRSFLRKFGREPKNESELWEWVSAL